MKPDDQNRDATLTCLPAIGMPIGLPVTISYRWCLSTQYLWAAKHFRSKADEIEQRGPNTEPAVSVEHRAYVTGAIFSGVAFAEAAVNECFKDIADDQYPQIDEKTRRYFEVLWDLMEGNDRYANIPLLEKFQLALRKCGKSKFELGGPPFQDAKLVVRLRNELMHYKPVIHTLGDKPHEFGETIRTKFPENRLMANREGAQYFPDRCLGSGCAEWVIKSVKAFADAFFARLGFLPHYQQVERASPTS